MNPMSERLLRAALEDGSADELNDLVDEVAASAEAQAELVRLVATFAQLPGDGARAAEERLEALLEAVTDAAVPVVVAHQHVATARA